MSKRQSVEGTIRDWLATNLDFIEPGLKLIKKEYFLKDDVGASGFVDLLCSDVYNNFVIIEIKRSENSARQTISEILKYHSLIKSKYIARESEIRTIVISTHWNELIRPFSETIHRTSLYIKGYRISIDEFGLPTTIETIEPLSKSFLSRKFAYWQGLYLFANENTRDAFHLEFREKILHKIFSDFVLIKAVGNLQDKRIIFPYGVILAFQKRSEVELLDALKKVRNTELLNIEEKEDFEDELEYLGYLEASLVNALDILCEFDEGEACYPQKINTMINAEDWTLGFIEKFGIFNEDLRYSDELLLGELMGLDGDNENVFFAVSESSQSERINEIITQCRYSLLQSPIWLDAISIILSDLVDRGKKFRIWIQIFNQSSLLIAMYHTLTKREMGYLPGFFLNIDYLDSNETEIYIGDIRWNGDPPSANFLKPLNKEEDRGEWVFGLFQEPNNDLDALKLRLQYAVSKSTIVDNHTNFEGFFREDNGKLIRQTDYILPFQRFSATYKNLLNVFVANFSRTYRVMK